MIIFHLNQSSRKVILFFNFILNVKLFQIYYLFNLPLFFYSLLYFIYHFSMCLFVEVYRISFTKMKCDNNIQI